MRVEQTTKEIRGFEPLAVWSLLRDQWGAEPLIENAIDGSVLLLIPGGTFLAGGTGGDEGGGDRLSQWSFRRFTLGCTP